MENYRAKIAERIKQLRKATGKNQQAFGDLVGVSKSAISKYENGEAFPTIDVLLNIVKIGGISFEWIFTGEELPKTPDEVITYPLAEDEKRAVNTAEDLLKYKGLDKRFAVVEIHHPPPEDERLNGDEKRLLEAYRAVDGAGQTLILSVAENTATAFKQKAGGSGGLRDAS